MASTSLSNDIAESEYASALAKAIFASYCAVAIISLLPLYEYIITFDREVATIWRRHRKLTFASVLLMSTRWYMVVLAATSLIPASKSNCRLLIIWSECVTFFGYIQVAAFSALRVSAIWERNSLLFIVVFALGLTPLVINVYFISLHASTPQAGTPCEVIPGVSKRTFDILVIATRTLLIIADALVLLLTSIKTYRQVVDGRRAGVSMSVSGCLLEDGAFYFIILFSLNIAVILSHRSSAGPAIYLTALAMPPVLTNRFMLNLRQISYDEDAQTLRGFSRFSAPRAGDSFFGNFGEPLEHGMPLSDDEGPEEVDEGPRAGDVS